MSESAKRVLARYLESPAQASWGGPLQLAPLDALEPPKYPFDHDPSLAEIRGIVEVLRKGVPADKLLHTPGARKYRLTKDDLDKFLKMEQRGLLKSH